MQSIGDVILFLADLLAILLNGYRPREALMQALEMQMGAFEECFESDLNLLEEDAANFLHAEMVKKTTKIIVVPMDAADTLGVKDCCSICLQDFKAGETARCLLRCRHLFHRHCIDEWLTKSVYCPICRRHI